MIARMALSCNYLTQTIAYTIHLLNWSLLELEKFHENSKNSHKKSHCLDFQGELLATSQFTKKYHGLCPLFCTEPNIENDGPILSSRSSSIVNASISCHSWHNFLQKWKYDENNEK